MNITRVLVNDDHDAIVDGVSQVLLSCGIDAIEKTQYCDEAYLKIRKAQLHKKPYDLLVTDLSFKSDHRDNNISSGEELIQKLREEGIDIPIIVYSMKDQPHKVRKLINTYKVNAYVCKDRKGSKELRDALNALCNEAVYVSPQVAIALQKKSKNEIDDFDVQIIALLSKGLSQEDISEDLKSRNILPNSLSTIEKRLNKLKIQFKANNAVHLVSISKDLGLI